MLKLYLGPMYSGKTTELIRNYNRFKKYNQLIIDYNTEYNYNSLKIGDWDELQTTLCNHNSEEIHCIKMINLSNIYKYYDLSDIKYIHINEAQFFTNLKDIVIQLVEQKNINVYLYGLDGDFKRNTFGELLSLIPFCDSVTKLKGICNNCDNNSLFSHRICGGSEQFLINDSNEDKYIPLCRKCYINKK